MVRNRPDFTIDISAGPLNSALSISQGVTWFLAGYSGTTVRTVTIPAGEHGRDPLRDPPGSGDLQPNG